MSCLDAPDVGITNDLEGRPVNGLAVLNFTVHFSDAPANSQPIDVVEYLWGCLARPIKRTLSKTTFRSPMSRQFAPIAMHLRRVFAKGTS